MVGSDEFLDHILALSELIMKLSQVTGKRCGTMRLIWLIWNISG